MTPESYILSGSIQVVEHFFTVPLDYSEPEGKKLRIFARHLVPLQKARTAEEQSKLPFLLYLQGGPGFECDLESSVQIGAPIHERRLPDTVARFSRNRPQHSVLGRAGDGNVGH
ncbi:Proline iminopeptidase [Mycena kentingensis (nom. inval.)]|nr:Proline iminopeptidase [Mycena kentingensis (nom. inval.)]